MIKLICEECGKEYQVKPYRQQKSHFCCNACAGKHKRKMEQQKLLGKKFGRLTIIGFEDYERHFRVKCKCDCGNEKSYFYECLRNGGTISCGCYAKEKSSTVNGLSRSRLYKVWTSMKNRCYNSNMANYQYYGGRGITVCEEWTNDFNSFYNWAMKNGYDENADYMACTLDRIDVNGNYEPNNCRWVSAKEQAQNKNNSILYFYQGEYLTLPQIAKKYNKSEFTLKYRINKGLSIEQAVEGKPYSRLN